ncbi:MAG: signal recognition particle protein [Nitrospinae bacterium]|nr:signal recognition particle protein [Nitrospinota bacterium]
MFEGLSNRLEGIFKKLRGRGKLDENNIKEAMRDVRVALLEADVNFKVVKDFIERVKERAIGQEVMKSLTPGHQMIKIVRDELIAIMGDTHREIIFAKSPPTIIMMVGLHGSGKTTTAGKLANKFQKDGYRVILVPADVYRPAAIEQLNIIGRELNIEVFDGRGSNNPIDICDESVRYAIEKGYNLVILDTAGRLHVDEDLMNELRFIKEKIKPQEVLLIADAMTGQDAVKIAVAFNESVGIDGIILTKMEGDARGGAALSIRGVTGKPIKFIGVGERLNDLEPFYPERLTSRILGMGDILSLVEKADAVFSEEEARRLEKKIRKDTFTLEDFRDQLQQVKKMGTLSQIIEMIPGVRGLNNIEINEKAPLKIEAIINSMTHRERANHTIINGSRKRRIAQGSGTTIQDVNRLLKQFTQMKKMIKKFSKGGDIYCPW